LIFIGEISEYFVPFWQVILASGFVSRLGCCSELITYFC
jgi:hypothetical protein